MKYTKTMDYALHVIVLILEHENQENLSLQKMAESLDVSPTYLSKILTQLTKAGLIRSTPGKNGGYCLRKNKEEISFLDVIEAVDGNAHVFVPSVCRSESCKVQDTIEQAQEQMLSFLAGKKVYEVLSESG